jgi:hypothetical protein
MLPAWQGRRQHLQSRAGCGCGRQVAVAVRSVHHVSDDKEVPAPQHRLVRAADKPKHPLNGGILCPFYRLASLACTDATRGPGRVSALSWLQLSEYRNWSVGRTFPAQTLQALTCRFALEK